MKPRICAVCGSEKVKRKNHGWRCNYCAKDITGVLNHDAIRSRDSLDASDMKEIPQITDRQQKILSRPELYSEYEVAAAELAVLKTEWVMLEAKRRKAGFLE